MTLRAASPTVNASELARNFLERHCGDSFSGNVINSLDQTVEGRVRPARGAPSPTVQTRPDRTDFFKLTRLAPDDANLPCSTVDCRNPPQVRIDYPSVSAPYCRACAHVEFAMWMVGV